MRQTPEWRLPQGVNRSLWEYAHDTTIAEDYDRYFTGNSLFEFDLVTLERHFTRPGLLVDLGCGTGRLLVPFARRGYGALAVDLSAKMLGVVRRKAIEEQLPIDLLRANMVELDVLADGVADYCISMFSTLGMIHPHENRQRAIAHAARILKPGGLLALHVHNRRHELLVLEGWLALGQYLWSRLRGLPGELGDRVFDYRGIPRMRLHSFGRRELRSLLTGAGLRVREWVPLDTERRHALRWPWLLGSLRANGWIVIAERPAEGGA